MWEGYWTGEASDYYLCPSLFLHLSPLTHLTSFKIHELKCTSLSTVYNTSVWLCSHSSLCIMFQLFLTTSTNLQIGAIFSVLHFYMNTMLRLEYSMPFWKLSTHTSLTVCWSMFLKCDQDGFLRWYANSRGQTVENMG